MRTTWNFLVFVGLAIVVCAPAMASGVGFDFYSTKSDLSIDDIYSGGDGDFDVERTGLSFLLDSNPLGDGVFCYRLMIGIHETEVDLEFGTADYEGYGLDMKHTFAWALAHNERFRVFLGPAMRIYYDQMDYEGYYDTYDMYIIGFGLGPELGFNIGFTERVALSLAAGYTACGSYMDWVDDDGTGEETMLYLNLGMLFGSLTY